MTVSKSVMFHRPDADLELVETAVSEAEIPANCVLVKMEAATICGSDLHTFLGRRKEAAPLVLGHEGVGRVLISGRPDVAVGSRVTWSIADSCMKCRMCHDLEMPQKCGSALMKYGHSQQPLTGCYSSHILLRPGTEIIAVPETMPSGVVAPINCALATVFAALEHVPSQGLSTALVQGAGLLGIYTALILKRQFKAKVVYIRDTAAKRLETAAKFGATPLAEEAPEGSCDAVLEMCGASEAVAEGLRSLRVGGTYVWVGQVAPGKTLPITGEQVVRKCAMIRGVHNYAPRHLRQAVEFVSSLPEDIVEMLDKELVAPDVFDLENLTEAFNYAMKGEYCRVKINC